MIFIINEEKKQEEDGLSENDDRQEMVELSTLEVLKDDEVALRTIMGFTAKRILKLK